MQNVPSVVTDRINVGGSESGGRANYFAKGASNQDNTVNLDGVSLQDGGYEYALGRVDFDSFQEVQVTTGGATTTNPSPGVQVNYVLKQGENVPHGSARVYFDNDSLQSNNVTPEYAAVIGHDKGNRIDRYMDYGFELGGPIVKDKAWFWGSASKMDLKQKDLAGNPARTTIKSYAFKSAWQATPAIRPSFTFFRSSGGPRALGLSPARPPETALIIDAPISLYKVQSDFVLAKNLFLTARVSKFNASQNYTPAGGIDKNVVLDSSGVWSGSFFYGTSERPQTAAVVDGSWFKGKHEFKFGFSYRSTPITSSSKIASDGQKIWTFRLGSFAQDGAMLGQVKRDWKSDTTGHFGSAWVGDTLVFNRATVNLALRFDRSTGSINEVTVPAVPNESLLPSVTAPGIDAALKYNTLSPRIGVSYALDENRKTLVRASYGMLSEPAQDPRRPRALGHHLLGRLLLRDRRQPRRHGAAFRVPGRAHRLLRLRPVEPRLRGEERQPHRPQPEDAAHPRDRAGHRPRADVDGGGQRFLHLPALHQRHLEAAHRRAFRRLRARRRHHRHLVRRSLTACPTTGCPPTSCRSATATSS